MHIQAPVLMFLGLCATAGCAPLNAAASRHLVEHDITKREDASGAVVNQIVRYTDDEIAKREDGSVAVVNQIVRYTDDEITKRGDGESSIANGIVL